jgi:glycosyltransferase 2 family protein
LTHIKINPRLKSILYRIGLGLGAALFVYQVWLAIMALRSNPAPLHYGYLVALLCLDLVAYVLLIVGWGIITRALRLNLSARHMFDGYVLAFLPRYIPGSVWGYVSRGEWMQRTCGASYSQSTAASLMEISVQFGTAGVVVLGGLAPVHWRLAIIVLGICTLAVPWWLLQRIYLRRQHVSTARVAVSWLLLFILYTVFWTVHGLTILMALQAVGTTATLTLPAAVFAFCSSWLVGFAAILVPAGLGVRELTLSALLQRMTTIPAGDASLVAVITRLGIVAAELIFLLFAAALMGFDRWRKQRLAYAPDHPDSLL